MIPKNFLKNLKNKSSFQKYVSFLKKPQGLSLNFKKTDLFNTFSLPSFYLSGSQIKDRFNLKYFKFNNPNISLYYQNTSFNDEIINRILDDKRFNPTLYLRHPFSQSVYNVFTFEKYNVKFQREYVKMPDGGQISLDWATPERILDNKLIFIIHGLTGGSEMPYVQSLVTESLRKGYKTVVFHNRGINGTALTTPEPFHGVKLDDIENAMKHIKENYSDFEFYGIGLSLGGNLLLRYAAQKKNQVEFKGLVAVATPFDLVKCLNNLTFVYEKFFLKRYVDQTVVPNLEMLKKLEKSHGVDLEKVMKAKTLREFHGNLTAKVFGFKNSDDYFNGAKITDENVRDISIPTLLLHSKDDPITTIHCVPLNELMHNKNIIYVETKNGGHVCWFYNNKPERVILYFF